MPTIGYGMVCVVLRALRPSGAPLHSRHIKTGPGHDTDHGHTRTAHAAQVEPDPGTYKLTVVRYIGLIIMVAFRGVACR